MIRALPIAAILFATNALVQAQDLDNGRTEFLSKCAGCHGADGKGASPMTNKLKRKPADLTALARNNNGVFSAAAILIHTINIIQRGSDELKSIVESFNDAIGWILAFASLLFPAMTWTQPKKYQAGFIIMLLCSIGLNCSCVGRALARWVRKNMWRCHVEKSSKSQPQSVVEYEVETELN